MHTSFSFKYFTPNFCDWVRATSSLQQQRSNVCPVLDGCFNRFNAGASPSALSCVWETIWWCPSVGDHVSVGPAGQSAGHHKKNVFSKNEISFCCYLFVLINYILFIHFNSQIVVRMCLMWNILQKLPMLGPLQTQWREGFFVNELRDYWVENSFLMSFYFYVNSLFSRQTDVQ